MLAIAGKKLLSSQQNALVILSGLMNVPCFGFTVLFEGGYWTPVRLGGWVLGIEDVLCAYVLAAMAWFATVFRLRYISHEPIIFFVVLRRYCIAAGISGVVFFPFYFLGVDVMTSFLLMCFFAGILLFVRLPQLRKLALGGIWKLPLLYLIIVKIYFLIWPDFAGQWNAASLWGRLFFGLPFGEIAWAVGFGFYWPLFMGYVFKIKVQSR